jgi:hypothetical protein
MFKTADKKKYSKFVVEDKLSTNTYHYSFLIWKKVALNKNRLFFSMTVTVKNEVEASIKAYIRTVPPMPSIIEISEIHRENAKDKIDNFFEQIKQTFPPEERDEYYEILNKLQDPTSMSEYDNGLDYIKSSSPREIEVWEQFIDMISPSEYVTK